MFRRAFLKGLLLFLLLSLLLGLLPLGSSAPAYPNSQLSLYNSLLPGRERLPFGEDSSRSYNLSLYDLDAMAASLRLSGARKAADEYRVLVVGDSSVWGTLLKPEQTLAGQLDALKLRIANKGSDKTARFYNLGYPTLSLTKDMLLLDQFRAAQPDLVIWLVTLESFPRDRQLESPIVANNPERVRGAAARWGLRLDLAGPALRTPSFWQRTLFGRRRALADWFRLQAYGVMWAATGIDQTYPTDYVPAARDLKPDPTFNGWSGPDLPLAQLDLDALRAGMRAAGAPVLLVNEPILISQGQNSDLRYNFYYPRWAYDQYRAWFNQTCAAQSWDCLDLWNLVNQAEFTNSAIHLTPAGEGVLAARLAEVIQK